MKHILEVEESELNDFCINKSYKTHGIKVKPIGGINKRELHVFMKMFHNLEIDLGVIIQEIAEDDEHFKYWVSVRLKYLSSFLSNI